ncbi:MAG TPA: hypothetical protein VJ183_03235 [Chloroflexia bacterium]|nr:hypothetical protein [Chloroflexia bacterium]
MRIPDLILKLILWGIVLLIMLILLRYAALLAISSDSPKPKEPAISDSPKPKKPAIAGFYAGIFFALIYILSQLNVAIVPDFSLGSFPAFNLGSIVFGAVVGFALLITADLVDSILGVALAALALSMASCSTLFRCFFLPDRGDTVLYIALGTALGVLLSQVFSSTLKKGLQKLRQRNAVPVIVNEYTVNVNPTILEWLKTNDKDGKDFEKLFNIALYMHIDAHRRYIGHRN